jgi:hypothetical protein
MSHCSILLGWNNMYSSGHPLMFQRSVLPMSSGWKSKLYKNEVASMLVSYLACPSTLKMETKKRWSYPCNRPWRPTGLWDVKASTVCRQSQMAVRLSALQASCTLPPGRFPVLISIRGWVDLRALVRREGLCQLKNPLTSSGIKPTTFQFVAYCLSQLCYCVSPDGDREFLQNGIGLIQDYINDNILHCQHSENLTEFFLILLCIPVTWTTSEFVCI